MLFNRPTIDLPPLPSNVDRWLRLMFWQLAVRLIYGPSMNIHLMADWNYVSSQNRVFASHLRLLEGVMGPVQPTFSAIASDFDTIVDRLHRAPPDRRLDYHYIRETMLTTLKGHLYHIYRPPKALELNLLDVVYAKDGQFIVLDNYREHIEHEIDDAPAPILEGAESYKRGYPDGSGLIRHRFYNPLEADIRTMTKREAVPDSQILEAWNYLAADAPRLLAMTPGLQIRDIVLVIRIETDLRYTNVTWTMEKHNFQRPPDVKYIDFVEYEKAQPGTEWGFWDCEGIEGVEVRRNIRCAQNIGFVQLENTDAKLRGM